MVSMQIEVARIEREVKRIFGKLRKLGAGYNFTDFSDDLTGVSYRSHGWFINLIGKM